MGNSGSSSLHQAPGKLGDYQSYYRTQIAGSDGYNRVGGVGGVVVGEGSASGDRFASHKRSFSTNLPTQQQQQQQQSSFGWRGAGNTNLIWDYPQQRPHQQLHNDHDHHYDDHHLHHHQHHHLHQQQPQPQQLHPKVLPTNFDRSFRLRSTKNGTILNTGGTLSGRKDSGSPSTPRTLQRSKTDLEKSQLLLSNRKFPNFRRSQTQISLDVDGDVDAANGGDQWRRSRRRRRFQMLSSAAAAAAAAQVSMSAQVDDFGESQLRTTTTMYLSEPDLRSSVRLRDANGGRRGGGGGTSVGDRDQMSNHETVVNRFASRKTKIKNKKRKAPLAPPAAPPMLLPPARAPPPPPLPPTTTKAAQTADATNERTKLRLFKTRIESTPSAGGVAAKCEGGATAAAASSPRLTRNRAAPLPYRREKSFDAKLLLNDRHDRHDHYQYIDDPHQYQQHRHHVSPPSTPATPRPTTTTRIPQLKKSFYFGMDSVNSVKKPITATPSAAATTTTTTTTTTTMKTTKPAVIRSVRGATKSGLFAAVAAAGGADVVDVVTESFPKSPGLAMVATTTYRGDGDDGDDDDDDGDDDDSESNDDEFRSSAKCPRGGGGGGGGCSVDGNKTVCTTMNDNGLRVHLYPTLPRRQLEVPRFSPAAAWRTLNENIASVSASASANATTASTINHELDLFQISNLVRSIPSLSADDDGAAAADSANSVKEKPISCTYRDPRSLNLERCLLEAGGGGGGGVDDNYEDDDDGGDGDSDISTDDALLWMSPSDFCRRRQQQQQKNNNNTIQQQHLMTSATQLVPPGPFLAPWTPQQDLDDDSSSDGDSSFTKFNRNNPIASKTADTTAAATTTKIAAVTAVPASSTLFGCGHVFSLSLPRDHHNHHQQQQNEHQSLGGNGISSMAITDKKNSFSSLQKLKRTISGGECAGQQSPTKTKTTSATTAAAAAADNNWVFGRTVFGLDDSKERRALKPRSGDDRRTSLSPDRHHQQPTSLTLVTAGKHVMYLPNNFIPSTKTSKTDANDTVIDARRSSSGGKATTTNTTIATATNLLKPPSAGKSPSIPTEHKRSSLENLFSSNRRQRKDGQLSSCVISETGAFGVSSLAASKGQRFSFQSTVRQIERRRLAEKLSKDAELKEAQRKSELEVMRRVEEDFQRKRAHEKANIRQQLRLYSSIENKNRDFLSLPFDGGCGMGEGGDDSLTTAMQQQQQQKPANLLASDSDSDDNENDNDNEDRADVGDGETFRADPDGAVSSVSSSSPLSFQNQAADAGKSTMTTTTPAKLLN